MMRTYKETGKYYDMMLSGRYWANPIFAVASGVEGTGSKRERSMVVRRAARLQRTRRAGTDTHSLPTPLPQGLGLHICILRGEDGAWARPGGGPRPGEVQLSGGKGNAGSHTGFSSRATCGL